MNQLSKDSTYQLSNGVKIPVIGLGTWQASDGEVARQSVLAALEVGYRQIDTAAAYQNEASIGDAIKQSGIAREDIFLTTKLGSKGHGYEEAKAALAGSLEKLGVDYLDLYLVHWPAPLAIRDSWQAKNQAMWQYLEEALEQGLVRSIGVSNFHPHHIDSLLETAKVKPHVNQIYLSPSDGQEAVVAYNNKHGIISQAYSPLGAGTLLHVTALVDIANTYNKTPAQVAIRWSLQKGFLPLPKSIKRSRIESNLDVFDFQLSREEMAVIETLKGCGIVAKNPDEVQF